MEGIYWTIGDSASSRVKLDCLPPQVVAVQLDQIEDVEEHAPVIAPPPQPVELRHAVPVAGDRLSVDQARAHPERAGGLEDQRKASRPIEAVAGEQLDAGGVPADHHAEAVVLDLVNPAGAGRRSLGRRRE